MTWEMNSLSRLEKVQRLEDRIFIVRKSCSEEKAKIAGQPLSTVRKLKHVTHGSPQPSQQKPGPKMSVEIPVV